METLHCLESVYSKILLKLFKMVANLTEYSGIKQIFAGWEVQTMKNFPKNVLCVLRSMF